MTIALKGSQSTWTLTGLVLGLPDHTETDAGMVIGRARPMTDEVKGASMSKNGFIEAPWKNEYAGQAVQVAIPGQ